MIKISLRFEFLGLLPIDGDTMLNKQFPNLKVILQEKLELRTVDPTSNKIQITHEIFISK